MRTRFPGILLASTTVFALVLTGIASQLAQPNDGYATHTECSDIIDNDGDGRTDYPQDPDCASPNTESEGSGAPTLTTRPSRRTRTSSMSSSARSTGRVTVVSSRSSADATSSSSDSSSSSEGSQQTQPLVTISVTDGRDRANAGDTLVYAVRVTGGSTTPVRVTLHVPPELSALSADNGGIIVDDTIVWSGVDAGGNTPLMAMLYVKKNVVAGSTAVVRVTSGGSEAMDLTEVRSDRAADVRQPFTVRIDPSVAVTEPGGSLSYIIGVRNDGEFQKTEDVVVALPRYVTPENAAGADITTAQTVTWSQEVFLPREERIFMVSARVAEQARVARTLRATVQVGQSMDDAEVRVGTAGRTPRPQQSSSDGVRVSITDNRASAVPGDVLSYVVTVKSDDRRDAGEGTVSVVVPAGLDFFNATDGGTLDGRTIRWTIDALDAGAIRSVLFFASVREDAAGTTVRTEAIGYGERGTDSTRIGGGIAPLVPVAPAPQPQQSSSKPATPVVRNPIVPPAYAQPVIAAASSKSSVRSLISSASPSSASSIRTATGSALKPAYVLLIKRAERGEAAPGGRVRYTVEVRNVLLAILRDAVVTDRYDDTQMEITDTAGGRELAPGMLQWKLPVLGPGKVWTTAYVARFDEELQPGTIAANTAMVSGNDVGDAPLSERVQITNVSVRSGLVPSGASTLGIAAVASAVLSAITGSVLVLRRRTVYGR